MLLLTPPTQYMRRMNTLRVKWVKDIKYTLKKNKYTHCFVNWRYLILSRSQASRTSTSAWLVLWHSEGSVWVLSEGGPGQGRSAANQFSAFRGWHSKSDFQISYQFSEFSWLCSLNAFLCIFEKSILECWAQSFFVNSFHFQIGTLWPFEGELILSFP